MIKTVIGIDPGKNIGVARLDAENQKLIYSHKSVVNWDNFCVFLSSMEAFAAERSEPVVFAIELFRLFAHKAGNQIGSEMDTSQVIGAVRYAGYRSNGKIQVVKQEPGILETGAKWSGVGLQYVGKGSPHMPDELSAYNHAYFYLMNNNFLRNRVLDEMDG